MLDSILSKLAMLAMFLLGITCGWAALVMYFPVSLVNILLGILALFFFLRGFELADKINKLGPFSDEAEEDTPDEQESPDEQEQPARNIEGEADEETPSEE